MLQDKQESSRRNTAVSLCAFFRRSHPAFLHDPAIPRIASGQINPHSAVGQALFHKSLTVHRTVRYAKILEPGTPKVVSINHYENTTFPVVAGILLSFH